MKLLRALAIFFSVLLIAPSLVRAEALTLAYSDFPPYEYVEDGKAAGILVQIVKDIFKEAGVDIKLVHYPFTRAYEEVKAGKIDGLFNFYKTEERQQFFDYSDSIIDNPLVFFVRADSDFTFSGDVSSLQGKRIGAMLGYHYGNGFDEAKDFTIDRTQSHQANFHKLMLGRIDAYPCDLLVGLYTIQQEKMGANLHLLSPPLNLLKGHIGFTKGKFLDEIAKINKVIEAMQQAGTIQKMIKDYVKILAQDGHCADCLKKAGYY